MGESSRSQGDLLLALSVGTWGRSATIGYLGPPKVDFSETQQIAYLDLKRYVFDPKNFLTLEAVGQRLPRAPGHSGAIFQNPLKLHICVPKFLFCTKNFFQHYVLSVNDSCMPWVTKDLFFRILSNCMFGSKKNCFILIFLDPKYKN